MSETLPRDGVVFPNSSLSSSSAGAAVGIMSAPNAIALTAPTIDRRQLALPFVVGALLLNGVERSRS
jgi:hypothetical protein